MPSVANTKNAKMQTTQLLKNANNYDKNLEIKTI